MLSTLNWFMPEFTKHFQILTSSIEMCVENMSNHPYIKTSSIGELDMEKAFTTLLFDMSFFQVTKRYAICLTLNITTGHTKIILSVLVRKIKSKLILYHISVQYNVM